MKKKNGYFALFIMLIISLTALGISINFSLNNKNEGNKIEIEINKEQKIENIIDITLNPSDVITYKVVDEGALTERANCAVRDYLNKN